ncbi:MAG TPA: hypothetical protein VKV22_03645 [Rhodanobacteraceae bacterium]|nr:hypothetical protein [Rhodanobacteraceae bacterium]
MPQHQRRAAGRCVRRNRHRFTDLPDAKAFHDLWHLGICNRQRIAVTVVGDAAIADDAPVRPIGPRREHFYPVRVGRVLGRKIDDLITLQRSMLDEMCFLVVVAARAVVDEHQAETTLSVIVAIEQRAHIRVAV